MSWLRTHGPMKCRYMAATLALCTALIFTGAACAQRNLPAGDPVVRLDGVAGGTLSNHRIAAQWLIRKGRLAGLTIHDESAQIPSAGSKSARPALQFDEPFSIELNDSGVLRARDLVIDGPPRAERLVPEPDAARRSERLPGIAIHYHLDDPRGQFTADWALTLRQGSSYIRQSLTLTAGATPLAVRAVAMIDVHEPQIRTAGVVKGSPFADGSFFLGFESPLAESSVVEGHAVAELTSSVPIPAARSAGYSSVIGVADPGQMRRSFLTYIERERAHPYRTFLHYNSWFDIGYENPYTQAEALDRIHAFGEELNKKRGVTLDSYLFDDGWDNLDHLWKIRSDFKDGFAPLTAAAAEYGAAPGVWLSPWGGYAQAKQKRLATARADKYEIVDGGLALSGAGYYKLFHDAVIEMVTKYKVNQFKFDGTGNVDQAIPGSAFSSDFDAAIHLIGDLRQIKSDIYINLTSGTWPSPFWLMDADSTWRGGDDTDFAGVGTDRERWITYRDAATYDHVVEAGPLYPLNSLMLHGIVYASKAEHLSSDPGNDFANEVHSYFGSGTQLQEMYISPSLLSEANWDTLAEAARWSRANADTLVDTHWIGGDPRWLEVYGWAAWSPAKGIVTLRNPSAQQQEFTIDVGKAFELPTDAARRYSAHSPWPADAAQPALTLEAGKPVVVHLAPFQVMTLVANPLK